jgi:predicted RNase H-like nuclease (RuvC/YqgF family)
MNWGWPQRLLALAMIPMLFLVTACTSIEHHDPHEEPSHEAVAAVTGDTVPGNTVMSEIDEMMEFYDSIRKQSAPDQGRVYEKAKQSFAQNKSDTNRARLILLLILPNTTFRDVPSALNLLNELRRRDSTSMQGFKTLLTSLLTEQQRLQHHVEELSQKLKDEQKRVETLQSQIDAIKSMEKNLLQQL